MDRNFYIVGGVLSTLGMYQYDYRVAMIFVGFICLVLGLVFDFGSKKDRE